MRRFARTLGPVAVAVLALTAAGCGGGSGSSSESSGSESTSSPSAEGGDGGGDADLLVWTYSLKIDAVKEVAEAFGESNGITVKVQAISKDQQTTFVTASQQGSGPDVMVGALGQDLILDFDCGEAGRFRKPHRVVDVHRVAESGRRIQDERQVAHGADFQTRLGQSRDIEIRFQAAFEITERAAPQVQDLEPGGLCELGAQGIENGWGDERAVAREQLAQLLPGVHRDPPIAYGVSAHVSADLTLHRVLAERRAVGLSAEEYHRR